MKGDNFQSRKGEKHEENDNSRQVLFLTLILLLVSGCSYNMENTQSSPDNSVGCSKFMSDYTQYDRDMCSH